MAKKKFTQLPVATTPLTGAEIIAIVQGGVSKQTTINDLPSSGGGGGTVTSVSIGNLSPLFTASVADATTTPSISFTLVNQNANLVYAGPTNGSAAAPSFRALVADDLPTGTIQDLQDVLDQGSSASITSEIEVAVTGASHVGFFRLHPSQGHEWGYENTGTSLSTTMGLNDGGWSVSNNLSGVSITVSTTDVTVNGPLILAADPTTALGAATKQYVDASVVGLWDDRGNFDASGGSYPSSGGSGTAGAILKGDIWTISVAGTLPTGQVVEAGDTVRALVDTPGNTQANWAIAQNNIGYTPITNVLNSAQILVGNASNVAAAVSMSGAVTIDNTGVTSYAGTVPVNRGGTNITSYAVGDLLYASGATTLSKLAGVAVGNVLISGGVTTAPAWGKVTSSHVDDTVWKVGGNTLSGAAVLGSTSAQDITMTVGNANYKLAINGTQALNVSSTHGWLFDVNGGTITATTAYDFRSRSGDTRVVRFANQANQMLWTLGSTNGEMFMGTGSNTYISPATRNSSTPSGTGLAYRASNSGGHYFLIGASNMGAYSQIDFGTTAGNMLAVSSTTGQWMRSRPAFDNLTTQTSVVYTFFELSPTINVTGGSTTLRAFDFNPTETSLTSVTKYGITIGGTTWLNGFGTRTPTALIHAGAVTTAAASLRIEAGSTTTAPSSPNSGDIWHEGTGNRLMFRQGGTSVEVIGTSSVNSVSPTSPNRTITVLLNNTTYYIHAKTTND